MVVENSQKISVKVQQKSHRQKTKIAKKVPQANENVKKDTKEAKVAKASQKDKTSQKIIKSTATKKTSLKKPNKFKKPEFAMLIGGAAAGVVGLTLAFIGAFTTHPELAILNFPILKEDEPIDRANIYSNLTGQPLSSLAEQTAPTFCIQVPNGTDGGRPQVGLRQAGVIFEAIAERGITRFAAIFENPTSAVIGPIRSLRLYYLEWDTPFDCTITHAGGADDALAAVSRGYRNLDENYEYMYRGTNGNRLWNNLFTTSDYLNAFNQNQGYHESHVDGFVRQTPTGAEKSRIDATVAEKLNIIKPVTKDTASLAPKVAHVGINFGDYASFNVHYDYDVSTNTYIRSYAGNTEARVYECPNENLGEKNPESICELKPLTPSVVVAMKVSEHVANDGYHESIKTAGEGEAIIFQNGIATKGIWRKASVSEQIRFFDTDGKAISLVPGQTIVEAVPLYGSVEY